MNLNEIVVILGMPRAGTTWLYENLKKHPQICVSEFKEINRYLLDIDDEAYAKLFPKPERQIKLDISPFYYLSLEAIQRIAKNHDKVILMTRDFDSWKESLENQIRKWGGKVEEMQESGIYRFPIKNDKILEFDFNGFSQEAYIKQIKVILKEKLLIQEFSLLNSDPLALLKNLEKFLGLAPYFDESNCNFEKINSSEQKIFFLYNWLFKIGILDKTSNMLVKILPSKVVHLLRKYLVYGR